MNNLRELKKELKKFVEREFKGEKYFCIIYGSYCYGLGTLHSDVDLTIVSEKVSKEKINKVASKIRKLHRKFDMELDDEVPHEIKGISDFRTLDLALKGKGFKSTGKKIIIPPVIKNKTFLRSKEVKMRLLLNALTSKAIFVCGNRKLYSEKKVQAFENLIKIIFLYSQKESLNPHNFVNIIIGTKEKNGEDFLGYKDKKVIRNYLINSIQKAFDKLTLEGKMQKKGKNYFIKDKGEFKEILR